MKMPALALFAALTVLSGPASEAAQEPTAETAVASRIEAVTVYLDRALVSRTAKAQAADKGLRTLVFPGLPSELEDASLRLKLSGPARLESLQARKTFLTQHQEEAVRKLEAELQVLGERLREQRDILTVIESGRQFLDSVQVSKSERISRDLGRDQGAGPNVQDYRAVLEFLTDERIKGAERVRKAQAALQELEPALNAKRSELEQLRSGARLEQKEVTAVLDIQAPGEVELSLSYMLPGALWFPAYDARADLEHGTLEMTYHAVIQQATGEDWNAAVLTLSAASPAVRMRAPEPQPWFLGAAPAAVQGQVAEEEQTLSSWNPCTNLKNQYSNRVNGLQKAHQLLLDNNEQVRLVFESAEKRRSSAVFKVARPESVASDGHPHRVTLALETLPMQLTFHAVPQRSQNTYVTGQVTNPLAVPFLPGQASIFIGPDLVGSSTLDFVAPGESASVTLGVDERIKVSRELDGRESSKAFFSKRKRLEVAYVVTVENFRAAEARIAIHESFPVSQDDQVSVRIRTLKPEPQENERGVARWDLTVGPGESRTLRFAYTLEYPEDAVLPQVAQFEEQIRQKK